MHKYLLRIEAVNFDASCYDTNDLSTIRGGSMMLSNAHELVAGKLPTSLAKSPVTFGASHSVWEFDAANDTAAEQLRQDVLKTLSEHQLLQHATFVCSVTLKQNGTEDVIQQLRMGGKWSQYQKPTVTYPMVPVQDGKKELKSTYCEFDRIRPSVRDTHKGERKYSVSQATLDRREYGKEQKRRFYEEISGQPVAAVNELRELTAHTNSFHRLNGKMAVVYIDGNKQSEMAARLGLSKLAEFRSYIRKCHSEFLQDLLSQISQSSPTGEGSSDWFYWDDKERKHLLRLETLLWGGDDIVLVVPAWKGLWTLQQFFRSAVSWTFDSEVFTHSAGIVFCSAKAPIRNMTKYADQLVIQCKKQCTQGRYSNLMAYEVLESFDVLDSELDESWNRRLHNTENSDDVAVNLASQLVLSPHQLDAINNLVAQVKSLVEDPDSLISRRQIEVLARGMQHRAVHDADFDRKVRSYFEAIPQFGDLCTSSVRVPLLHLAALWDYVE